MSPTSKAWTAEHDRLWSLEDELIQSGALCHSEPIPWVLYIPQKPTTSVVNHISISPLEPCIVKDNILSRSRMNSPRVACAPILSIIEEVEADYSPSLDMSDSTLSVDTIWSQESAELSPFGIPARILETDKDSEDSIPSIVVIECPDTSILPSDSFGSKLSVLSVHQYDYGMDFLQVPVPGVERSRPILGTVNRSNFTGGKFKLSAPPRKRGPIVSPFNKVNRENTLPSGYF